MNDYRYLNQLDSETLEKALVEGEDLGAVTELPAAFQFLSHVQDLEDEQIYPDLERQPAFADFVEAAEKGLERDIAERKGSIAEVTVTVEVESLQPPEAAMRQLEEGENSASEELWLATLLQHTGVRREELSAIGPEDIEDEQ
jgi:integrase